MSIRGTTDGRDMMGTIPDMTRPKSAPRTYTVERWTSWLPSRWRLFMSANQTVKKNNAFSS
eukprot:4488719-Pyramimonas_sp.AAC.1